MPEQIHISRAVFYLLWLVFCILFYVFYAMTSYQDVIPAWLLYRLIGFGFNTIFFSALFFQGIQTIDCFLEGRSNLGE